MKQPPLPDRRVRPALAGPMVRRNALCSVAAMAMIPALAGSGWSQSRPAGNLPAITQVAQIRRLTPAEAKRKYPIRLKGVITYHAPEYKVTFFQDDTAGIFIYEATDTQIGAGSLVEIDGNTTPGDFAPSIEHAEIHLIGRAPLPAAAPKSIDALLTGAEDSQWVEVQGIVHSATIEDRLPPDMRSGPPQLVLDIHFGGDSFKARIQGFGRNADFSRLVGAGVTVRGVCGALFNNRRQLGGVQLFVPSLEQLTVDMPPAADVYALPQAAIGSLTQFSPERAFGRRVHVRGVVTLRNSNSAFVQDNSGGVLVESQQAASVAPGDLVDAAGFPTAGHYAPILESGSFRIAGKGAPPAPAELADAASLSSGDHDAELVRIDGRLLNQSLIGKTHTFTLELGGRVFTGRLDQAAGADRVRSIRDGSQLRLTGVLWMQTDQANRPFSNQVLLRSAADIAVLQSAPWMTGPRFLVLLGALGGAVLLTLLWVAILRRRVEEKTETLRAVLESTEEGILAVDSEGRVAGYNHKCLEMWGIPETLAHSAADEDLTQYVAGQLKDPAAFIDATRRLYREPEAKTHDVLELADGRVFERHSEPRRVKGKCVGRVWGYRDVTERKKVEQRLRSLSAAVEQSPVNIVITDLEGNIEYVNPKFSGITGYAFEEVLGRNSMFLKSGETSQEEYRNLWETIKSGKAWKGTFHNKKKNGELYWVAAQICAIHDASGAPTHYLAVEEDITQQRLASEALQKSEGRYRGLVEHMLEGFVYSQVVFENGKAADFIYLGVNGAFETLTGLKDVLGKTASEVFPGIRETDPEFLEVHGRVALTGKPERLETYVAAMRMWLSISLYSPEKGYFIAVFDVITERKRAEEALRDSEANFRELFDCAPVGYHELDKDGIVRRVNRAECALFGYQAAEMLGRPVWDFIAGAERETSREVFRQKLSGERPLEPYQRRYLRRGGGELWVEIHDILVRNATGETVGVRTALLDITKRRQAEDALRTSQERFRIAAENASDIVYEFDLDTGRLEFFGDRVQERFPKLTFPETLAEWFPMLHPDDVERAAEAVRRHVATHEPLEVECRMPQSDGETLHAEIRASITRDPITGRGKSIGVIRDVTQRKAAEQVNAELAAVVKSTDAAIVRKDRSGRVLTWNSGAERMYGYRASEMIGRTTYALLPPDRVKELEDIEASLARGSEVDHFETVRIAKNGERLDIMLTASPIRDDAGNVVGSAHIAWNITARKRLEWQLAQAQKLESIGQLAAGIAHEINTPIQYIGDNARFLGDAFQDLFRVIGRNGKPAASRPGSNGSAATVAECPPDDVDVDYLQQEVPVAIGQLEEGVAHVARIVRAMKEFSHPGPVEKVCVDINRALDSTILVSRNEWKYVAELKSDFDPELPPVPCVPGEMNQVFLNLIVNAAHAVGDVVRDSGRKGAITVATRRNGDWAEIRIRDTGAGIPDEIRTKVFDPFFTTKEVGKGTGQGLSIAHAVVVQKHQGSIDFESRVGAGTTFLIRLPLDA